MRLNPNYDGPSLIDLGSADGAVAGPLVSQRRRMVEALEDFGPEAWAGESRCSGWSAREVALHLEGTNQFWVFSIRAALAGEPTRILAEFDPVATPAGLVQAGSDRSAADVFEGFAASTEALVELVGSLGDADWTLAAEAPPGHITVDALAHHALWDSWIHERDVLLHAGVEPAVVPGEVEAALRYAALLGPAFAASRGTGQRGSVQLRGTGPEVTFTVEAGEVARIVDAADVPDVVVEGSSVQLLEALSIRVPISTVVAAEVLEGPHRWMLDGLAEVFDS